MIDATIANVLSSASYASPLICSMAGFLEFGLLFDNRKHISALSAPPRASTPPSSPPIGNFSSDAPLGHARNIDERSRYRSHDQAMASTGLHQQDVRDGATKTVGSHGGKGQLHAPYLNMCVGLSPTVASM